MPQPTVAVVGASSDRRKFGNKSLRAHALRGYTVYPVNPREEFVEGHRAYASVADLPGEGIDRVTMYLPPALVLTVLEQIAAKQVREVWLNPGTDSPEVSARARELGLNVVRGCSIVDLGMSPSDLDE